RIFQRQVKTRGSGIALAASTATQLIVDTTGLVTLGTYDAQTAGRLHGFVVGRPLSLDGSDARFFFLVCQGSIGAQQVNLLLDAAAEHNVGTPARHISGNGNVARLAGLGNNFGFTRVLLGIEHRVRQFI